MLTEDLDIEHRLLFAIDIFEIFDNYKDRLMLAKLINNIILDIINKRILNRLEKKIKTLNVFHIIENNNIIINFVKGIEYSIINIDSEDIIEV